MCLIAFSFTPGQQRHLLLAANRDELHERSTRAMTWWRWPAGPLAGRDEQAGGTWLAVGRDGRWAAVTNYRDPGAEAGRRSRGELPVQYLESGLSPQEFVCRVDTRRLEYGPFNLLAGGRDSLWYGSSHARPAPVSPGVHALSNGLLDAPWPKSQRVATALRGLESETTIDLERFFGLMDDRVIAPDDQLPDTGVGADMERLLSPPFIVGARYGTRCSSILSLGMRSLAAERAFDPAGHAVSEMRYEFALEQAFSETTTP